LSALQSAATWPIALNVPFDLKQTVFDRRLFKMEQNENAGKRLWPSNSPDLNLVEYSVSKILQ